MNQAALPRYLLEGLQEASPTQAAPIRVNRHQTSAYLLAAVLLEQRLVARKVYQDFLWRKKGRAYAQPLAAAFCEQSQLAISPYVARTFFGAKLDRVLCQVAHPLAAAFCEQSLSGRKWYQLLAKLYTH